MCPYRSAPSPVACRFPAGSRRWIRYRHPVDASESGARVAPCSLCGSAVPIPGDAEAVACPHCARAHMVHRSPAGGGEGPVRLLALTHEAQSDAKGRGQGQHAMALGFAGLFLAAAFLFGAREFVNRQLLEPACTAACASVGLEMGGMSSPGAGTRSLWKAPDTCSCGAGGLAEAPPTCTGSSSAYFKCDAGFWFDGGRWLVSLLVNGLFVVGFILPFLVAGLVAVVRRRRSRVA